MSHDFGKVRDKTVSMTATIEQSSPADLTDDALYAEEPPDEGETAGQDGAPYGYTRDRKTGELRAKVRPGRPKHPPGAEELSAREPVAPEADAPPPDHPHGRRRTRARTDDTPAPPMPRGGVIAREVNRMYRRAGKIVRAMDEDIGQAIIECTRPEQVEPGEEPNPTVGEAWENLCKTNPRIRRWILQIISKGAWTELLLAHAPIGMALFMKPAIAGRLINSQGFLGRLAQSFFEPDEDTQEGDLTPEDGQEMADLAESQFEQMADRVAAKLPPEMADRARAAAERAVSRMANGLDPGDDPDLPPEIAARLRAVRRQQPRHTSRAARKR